MAVDGSDFEPFRCEVSPDRDGVRVRPVGELDLLTVPVVDAQLAELWSVGFTRVLLDLRAVTFIDSTCLHMLMTWQSQALADGLTFAVIAGPRAVERALTVAGLGGRLTYWG
jgi:anti-anti-sigma factor